METLKLLVKSNLDYKKKWLAALKKNNEVDVIFNRKKYQETFDDIKNIMDNLETVEQLESYVFSEEVIRAPRTRKIKI